MLGEELPQDDEELLVRKQHLPDRLDPGRCRARRREVLRELLAHHPLPWVQLEDAVDPLAVSVDEAVGSLIELDVLHEDLLHFEAGETRRLRHVAHRVGVFDDELAVAVVVEGCQVQPCPWGRNHRCTRMCTHCSTSSSCSRLN